MHTDRRDVILFVYAHQDDEYFALPWICDALTQGYRVISMFLTDGGSRTPSTIRDEESRAALTSLGIDRNDIAFIGTALSIPDGRLAYHLSEALEASLQWFKDTSIKPSQIFSPDWEGGHHDHDAAHCIALALANYYQAPGWGFSLYNAFRSRRPLFRVLNLLPTQHQRSIHYGVTAALRYAQFCWRYKSQRRTWLGLFPEGCLRRVITRCEKLNAFDIERIARRPHTGELLYERMFGQHFEAIHSFIKAFMGLNPVNQ